MLYDRRGRIYAALALSAITAWASQPVPFKPESLGFSTERLHWLHETIQREVDDDAG